MGGINRIGNQINLDNNRQEPIAKKVEVKVQTVEVAFRDSKTGDGAFQASMLKAQLTRSFNAQTATPNNQPPVDQAKVDDALKTIKERLSENIFDWDVTHGDLNDIQNSLKNLTPEESKAVFENLSDDDLKKMATELNGLIGSYSADEKKVLFDAIAQRLDGKNLARFADALNSNGKPAAGNNGQSDVHLLAQSIAENASPEAKAEFAKTLAADAETSPEKAASIALVIGGLKGDSAKINEVLGSLNDKQLKAVVNAGINETFWQGGGAHDHADNVSYNAKPLADLLEAVKTSNDPRVKARVFAAGADALKAIETPKPDTMRNNDGAVAARQVRDGLTNLIESDPNKIVRQLRLNDKSQKGEAMTVYTKSMIESGQSEKVSGLLERLVKGEGNKSAKEHLEESTRSKDGKTEVYNNVQDLGYAVGAVEAATSRIAAVDTKQAELYAKILGAAVGDVSGLKNIPGGGLMGAGVEEISKAFLTEAVKQRSKEKIEKGDEMIEQSNPRNAASEELTEGALEAYETMLDRVADRQDRASKR